METPAKYYVEVETSIDAPIEAVWRNMTDWDAYPAWNPFIVRIEQSGTGRVVGDALRLRLVWADGRRGKSDEMIVAFDPPREGKALLAYRFTGFLAKTGMVRATRIQELRSDGGKTVYRTREEFRGLLARFVPFAAVRQGFETHAQALAHVSVSAQDSGKTVNNAMKQSIAHLALVVRDYDEALDFYVNKLHFQLIEDSYQPEQDKRWVVIAPPGSSGATLLLARASKPEQEAFIGNQAGGRVFLFLSTDDFWRDYHAMVAAGITFVRPPKEADYGMVAVFADLYGNLWDLLQFRADHQMARRLG